jgi:hypothetical protein
MNANKVQGLKVKAGLKAGGLRVNHSRPAAAIRVKSSIKAGDGIFLKNHSSAIFSAC